MSDVRLMVAGPGGRMGRTLVKAIAETPGLSVAGAVEAENSLLIGQDCGVLAGLAPHRRTIVAALKPLLAAGGGTAHFTPPAPRDRAIRQHEQGRQRAGGARAPRGEHARSGF